MSRDAQGHQQHNMASQLIKTLATTGGAEIPKLPADNTQGEHGDTTTPSAETAMRGGSWGTGGRCVIMLMTPFHPPRDRQHSTALSAPFESPPPLSRRDAELQGGRETSPFAQSRHLCRLDRKKGTPTGAAV